MWTGPAVASFVIALVALIASLASIGWQVFVWRRSGPRLTVRVGSAFGGPNNYDLVAVTIVNSGRSPTWVREFALELPDGSKLIQVQPHPLATVLPAELTPGAEAAAFFERAGVLTQLASKQLDRGTPLRGYADTGHGKVYGRKATFAG